MAYPTDADIDAAVPPAGEPSRSLTNGALKAIIANATMLPDGGSVPLRTVENGPFTAGRVKATPAMDPEDCVIMAQTLVTGAVPASATASGVMGQFAVTGEYLYICTAPDTWVRFATTAW